MIIETEKTNKKESRVYEEKTVQNDAHRERESQMSTNNLIRIYAEYEKSTIVSLLTKYISSILDKIDRNVSLSSFEKFIAIIVSFSDEFKTVHSIADFIVYINNCVKDEYQVYEQTYIAKSTMINIRDYIHKSYNANSANKIKNVNVDDDNFDKFLSFQRNYKLSHQFNVLDVVCNLICDYSKKHLLTLKLNTVVYNIIDKQFANERAIIARHICK